MAGVKHLRGIPPEPPKIERYTNGSGPPRPSTDTWHAPKYDGLGDGFYGAMLFGLAVILWAIIAVIMSPVALLGYVAWLAKSRFSRKPKG